MQATAPRLACKVVVEAEVFSPDKFDDETL